MPTPVHVQTQTEQVNEAGGSSVTMSNFAVGNGANRSLGAVFYMFDDGAPAPTGSSVVFNTTENFTFCARATINFNVTFYMTIEIWTLDNPSNVTGSVVATASEFCDRGIGLAVMEFTGANNGIGVNIGSAGGNSLTPSVTFTTSANDSLIIAGHMNPDPGTFATPGTGVTERADWQIWWPVGWAGQKDASGGSDTVNTTLDGIQQWVMVAVELKAASGAIQKNVSDVGSMIDSPAITASLGVSDVGLGIEVFTLSATLLVPDTGLGSDDIVVSVGIIGSTVWGQITGVAETNIRTFAGNWTGTGQAEGSGDSERLKLCTGDYMISEVVDTGIIEVTLLQNYYSSGDNVLLQYRHGATEADCLSAGWNTYTVPFMSLGFVQVRVESTV